MTDEEITLVLRYLGNQGTEFEPFERETLYRLAGDRCTVDLARTQPMLLSRQAIRIDLISALPAHIRVALKLTS